MKEQSIEEKAKQYDEDIQRAKELLEIGVKDTRDKMVVLSFFPELKESEDEKTRKELVQFIKNWKDHNNIGRPHDFHTLTRNVEQCDRYIAWLEKQGERKTEPKFQNGQWIVWQNKCYKVNDNGCGYELIDQNGLSTSLEYGTIDESARLWYITKDAKDGDVLQLGLVTAIFQEYIGNGKCKCYCSICGEFCIPSQDGDDNSYGCSDAAPATKEQRDILLNAIYEAGYTFDFEKKELKKIEQNLAWSEEDEMKIADILALLRGGENCHYNTPDLFMWLKSIKDHVYLKQNQEWSEIDEEEFQIAIDILVEAGQHASADWLQSLKDRYTWKPSEEQIKALDFAADCIVPDEFCFKRKALKELYKDLKKLREE